jgi:hypothetical protein
LYIELPIQLLNSMSRFGGRRSGDDLAYGELPQRWDRSRFERFGGGGPPPRQYEEDYRFSERDGPRGRDVQVADRIDERGPRGRFEERDRYYEQDRYTPGGRVRRSDKELFGDMDPREFANMQIAPYRGPERTSRDEIDIDIDINRRNAPPRPGIMRRQSSLDTYDRRPMPRYDREYDYPVAPYTPVPLPMRRDDGYGQSRYEEPEDYREVEITRERSVHRTRGRAKSTKSSKAKSVTTKRSSSSSSSSSSDTVSEVKSRHTHRSHKTPTVHESFHEDIHTPGGLSIHESFHESVHGGSVAGDSTTHISKKFKKGKTRMPKRLVRREAIMDLGYPFDEEEDFFVLRIALEKEQIDEVIKISESYKSGGVYRISDPSR